MDRIALRFLIAGTVIVLGGTLIATTGAGIGGGAGWKGSVVILAGTGLIVSGWLRLYRAPPRD